MEAPSISELEMAFGKIGRRRPRLTITQNSVQKADVRVHSMQRAKHTSAGILNSGWPSVAKSLMRMR